MGKASCGGGDVLCALFCFVLFLFLFYFILFYFILFYFILFYFIFILFCFVLFCFVFVCARVRFLLLNRVRARVNRSRIVMHV